MATHPGTLGHARSTPCITRWFGVGAAVGCRAGVGPSGAFRHPAHGQIAGPTTGHALGRRFTAQQAFSSVGADGALFGHPVRPKPGAGTEQHQ